MPCHPTHLHFLSTYHHLPSILLLIIWEERGGATRKEKREKKTSSCLIIYTISYIFFFSVSVIPHTRTHHTLYTPTPIHHPHLFWGKRLPLPASPSLPFSVSPLYIIYLFSDGSLSHLRKTGGGGWWWEPLCHFSISGVFVPPPPPPPSCPHHTLRPGETGTFSLGQAATAHLPGPGGGGGGGGRTCTKMTGECCICGSVSQIRPGRLPLFPPHTHTSFALHATHTTHHCTTPPTRSGGEDCLYFTYFLPHLFFLVSPNPLPPHTHVPCLVCVMCCFAVNYNVLSVFISPHLPSLLYSLSPSFSSQCPSLSLSLPQSLFLFGQVQFDTLAHWLTCALTLRPSPALQPWPHPQPSPSHPSPHKHTHTAFSWIWTLSVLSCVFMYSCMPIPTLPCLYRRRRRCHYALGGGESWALPLVCFFLDSKHFLGTGGGSRCCIVYNILPFITFSGVGSRTCFFAFLPFPSPSLPPLRWEAVRGRGCFLEILPIH